MKLVKPTNSRPVRDGDTVCIWGFTHTPGLYKVQRVGTVMTTVSPLREDGTPAKFAQGARYEDLILQECT